MSDSNKNTSFIDNNDEIGGSYNVCLGVNSNDFNITQLEKLTAVGYNALNGSQLGNNIAVGSRSMEKNVYGQFNTAVGVDSLNELINKIDVSTDCESKPVFNEEKVIILDQQATIDNFDIHVIDPPFPDLNLNDDFLLNDIEILE